MNFSANPRKEYLQNNAAERKIFLFFLVFYT